MSCSSIAPSVGAPATAGAGTVPVPAVLTSAAAGTSGGGPAAAGGGGTATTPDLTAAIQALYGAIGSLKGALEGAAQATSGGGGAASGCTCGGAQAGAGVDQVGQAPAAEYVAPAAPPAPSTPAAPATPAAPTGGATQAPAGFHLHHPLKGARVSSDFGEVSSIRNNRPHGGTDLAKPQGSEIQAAAPGKVVQVAMDADGYGNYITIDHGNGWYTRYAHMVERSPLKEGDVVAAGQAIGKVGSTGNSTGPHLHFEVLKGGTGLGNRIDAAPFLSGEKTF